MEAYSKFAEVYDLFMQDIPYEQWCNYITDLLHKYGIMDGIVLELGCGTGNLTKRLASKGYDMIGVDNSEAMLEVAMEKERTNPQGILYLLQDMREFELYGTVRAVVSVCDSMNYLLEEGELEQVFRLVNNYLDPKGIFIFDLKRIIIIAMIQETRFLEKTKKTAALFGKIIIMKKKRSMNMP